MISRRSAYFVLLRQILSDFHSPRQGYSLALSLARAGRFSLHAGARQVPLRFTVHFRRAGSNSCVTAVTRFVDLYRVK